MTKEQMIRHRFEEVLIDANRIFNTNIDPDLSITVKGKSYLGYAMRDGSKVELNVQCLTNDDVFNHVMDNTIPHEIAHIVCFILFPNARAHGKEWKNIFLKLGGNGKRTSIVKLEAHKKMKRYAMIATCGKVMVITQNRLNKIKKGSSYTVIDTGGKLNYMCDYRLIID